MFETKRETKSRLLVDWYCNQMFGCNANVAIHVLTIAADLTWEAAMIRLLVQAREYLHGFAQDTCVTTCIRIAEKKRLYKTAKQATHVSAYVCGKRVAFTRYQSK